MRPTMIVVIIFNFVITILFYVFLNEIVTLPGSDRVSSTFNGDQIVKSEDKTPKLNYVANLTSKPSGYTNNSYKIVHLDFKGAPPTLSYLKVLLPRLAAVGCTGLLIEYEDMFPFRGNLSNLSSKNAFTKTEVRQILIWAEQLGLEVIPLVQTISNMEFVLKLPEWSHLREMPLNPNSISTSKIESLQFVKNLLSQVIQMHAKNIKYIHLGGAQSYPILNCTVCGPVDKTVLYSNFINNLGKWTKDRFNIQSIIWDDVVQKWEMTDHINHPLSEVQLMIWFYGRGAFINQALRKWDVYYHLYKKIWVAGAFKGVSMASNVFPKLSIRIQNQVMWMTILLKIPIPIVGYVLYGPSRLDHFSILGETLPASIPSLFLNLLYIQRPKQETSALLQTWRKSLGCSGLNTFKGLVRQYKVDLLVDLKKLVNCSFPGVDAYVALLKYVNLKQKVKVIELKLTREGGWLSDYNVIHKFSNNLKIIEQYKQYQIFKVRMDLFEFKTTLKNILKQYTNKYSIDEWIEQNILPLQNIINGINKNIEMLIKQETWPRRPLN